MAQPPAKSSHHHHHHHHHHHTQHITDPSRRKKKHLPAQVSQLQDLELDESQSNFISSSRDASEEDNDEAEETFDDDASVASLRQHDKQLSSSSVSAVPISSSTASLPPNERDQALIDSAPRPHPLSQSHKAKVQPAGANDRTPSSSSPPKFPATTSNVPYKSSASSHQQHQQADQRGQAPSSEDDYDDSQRPSVHTTLANAAAALSRSSSAELLPKIVSGRPAAGQDANARATKGAAGLNLGSLPSANVSSSAGQSTTKGASNVSASQYPQGSTVATPKASADATKDLSLASTFVPTAESLSGQLAGDQGSKRKVSGSHHHSGATASGAGTKRESSRPAQLEEGANTDGATPYDGDVEYAARTPVSTQLGSGMTQPGGKDGPEKASNPPSTPAAVSSSASVPVGTAPRQVPSRSYFQVVGSNHPDSQPADSDFREDGFEASQIPSAEAIRAWVHDAIFNPDPKRDYSINKPPKKVDKDGKEKPIRIYADGVYDLFHYAHALQLRQAKLSFPNVHLIVGVVSSYSCAKHKNRPILTSDERYECVRNCRWVDEVLEDAPWIIDQDLIDRMEIDFVAHDDLPYAGQGMEDVYSFVKKQGRFLPTRRTEGVSTSELLGRIVDTYRDGTLDQKLAKVGLGNLAFNGSA